MYYHIVFDYACLNWRHIGLRRWTLGLAINITGKIKQKWGGNKKPPSSIWRICALRPQRLRAVVTWNSKAESLIRMLAWHEPMLWSQKRNSCKAPAACSKEAECWSILPVKQGSLKFTFTMTDRRYPPSGNDEFSSVTWMRQGGRKLPACPVGVWKRSELLFK